MIRSFPLCGVKVLHPSQNDLTRPPVAATAKKNQQRYVPWLVYLTQSAAWFAVSLPTDAKPTYTNTYIYILIYIIYLVLSIYMEVASSDDVGLVEVFDRFGRGLDERFFFFFCG